MLEADGNPSDERKVYANAGVSNGRTDAKPEASCKYRARSEGDVLRTYTNLFRCMRVDETGNGSRKIFGLSLSSFLNIVQVITSPQISGLLSSSVCCREASASTQEHLANTQTTAPLPYLLSPTYPHTYAAL